MAPTDAELKRIFRTFDKDGSGKIDMDELAAALAKGGKELSKEELENIVKLVDKNNVRCRMGISSTMPPCPRSVSQQSLMIAPRILPCLNVLRMAKSTWTSALLNLVSRARHAAMALGTTYVPAGLAMAAKSAKWKSTRMTTACKTTRAAKSWAGFR